MKKQPKYIIIPDANIDHHWECKVHPESVAIVSPDWYEDNGTPICEFCGDDMIYKHTKVKVPNE